MGKIKIICQRLIRFKSKVRSKILRGVEKVFKVQCIEPWCIPEKVVVQNVQLETINGANEVHMEAYRLWPKETKNEIAMKIGIYLNENGYLKWDEYAKYSPYSHETIMVEATLKAVLPEKVPL